MEENKKDSGRCGGGGGNKGDKSEMQHNVNSKLKKNNLWGELSVRAKTKFCAVNSSNRAAL